MAFLKRFFSSTDQPAMKTIVYRGGVVKFRIPAQWREEYSDIEGGTFYEYRPGSGTLRLTILTLTAPRELQSDSAIDVLQSFVRAMKSEGVEGTTQVLKVGNAVFKYEQAGSERGVNLEIFYWIVANPLPPRRARVATFSYTILARQRNQSRVRRDLEMIEAEIEAAVFSPEPGVVSA